MFTSERLVVFFVATALIQGFGLQLVHGAPVKEPDSEAAPTSHDENRPPQEIAIELMETFVELLENFAVYFQIQEAQLRQKQVFKDVENLLTPGKPNSLMEQITNGIQEHFMALPSLDGVVKNKPVETLT